MNGSMMRSIALALVERRRVCAALVWGALLSGCVALDRPEADGFTSYVAQNVMRISMVVAFEEASFEHVRGRRFAVDVSGMGTGELHAYLDHIARTLSSDAGGVYDPDDPEVIVELAVHASGTDLDESPAQIAWLAQNAVFTGFTFLDLRFRERDGAVTPPQTLQGVASHKQSVVLSVFKGRGKYYRRTYPWLDQVLDPGEVEPIDPAAFREPRPGHRRD